MVPSILVVLDSGAGLTAPPEVRSIGECLAVGANDEDVVNRGRSSACWNRTAHRWVNHAV